MGTACAYGRSSEAQLAAIEETMMMEEMNAMVERR